MDKDVDSDSADRVEGRQQKDSVGGAESKD